jgi:hypothetical protein
MRNIAATAKVALKTKITDWRRRHNSIPAADTTRRKDSMDSAAPYMFQHAVGTDDLVGFHIHKNQLNEAINGTDFPMPTNPNCDAWDFLVCYIGLEIETLPVSTASGITPRPIVHFYKGGVVGGKFVPVGNPVETLVIRSGGPGGGGGVTANSNPPPTPPPPPL